MSIRGEWPAATASPQFTRPGGSPRLDRWPAPVPQRGNTHGDEPVPILRAIDSRSMRERGRIRIACSWGCTALALVMVVVLIAGRWRVLRLTWTSRDRAVATMTIGAGVVRACRSPMGLWAPTGLRIEGAPAWEWGWSGDDDRFLPGAWHFGLLYCHDPKAPRVFGFGLLFPTVATALPSAIYWWFAIRSLRRARAGLCRSCGYDCCGIAPGAACPECGSRPA
jgi:hypothetical protein